MAFGFASVTSEEITQINDETVPENTKKLFKGNGLKCYFDQKLTPIIFFHKSKVLMFKGTQSAGAHVH